MYAKKMNSLRNINCTTVIELNRILKHRLLKLRELWKTDELIWIPSRRTKETQNAGMLTLATRLGLEEQTFALLKKQSGCTKFGSWNKLLGTAITTYEAQYYRIAWVALGTHVPGPNGWEKSPNYFYDRAMSRLTAECSNHNLKCSIKPAYPLLL